MPNSCMRFSYKEKVHFKYSVAVERRTAKLLQYDNRLSVGTNALEG